MQPKTTIIILTMTLTMAASTCSARIWRDGTGQYSVDADLIAVKDGAVILERLDGRVVKVPVDKLCQADQDYLASLSKPNTNPKPNPTPPMVAPSWTMDLSRMTPPDTPVTGTLRGRTMEVKRAEVKEGSLTLYGASAAVKIHLFLKEGESPAEKEFAMPDDKSLRAPVVVLTPPDGAEDGEDTETFLGDFALKLKFKPQSGRLIQGDIYLCLPDAQKSFLAGTFFATARDF